MRTLPTEDSLMRNETLNEFKQNYVLQGDTVIPLIENLIKKYKVFQI